MFEAKSSSGHEQARFNTSTRQSSSSPHRGPCRRTGLVRWWSKVTCRQLYPPGTRQTGVSLPPSHATLACTPSIPLGQTTHPPYGCGGPPTAHASKYRGTSRHHTHLPASGIPHDTLAAEVCTCHHMPPSPHLPQSTAAKGNPFDGRRGTPRAHTTPDPEAPRREGV